MRDEARVIAMDEWLSRTNAETRRLAGVSVVPEECQEARAIIDGLMTDREAGACAAADLERVGEPVAVTTTEDIWSDSGWRAAAVEYHKDRGSRASLVESTPAQLARLRGLLDDSVTLESAWAELSKPPGITTSTLQAAEFLVLTGDVPGLQSWLARHNAHERISIRKHLEASRCRSHQNK